MQLDRTTKTGQKKGVHDFLLHPKFDQYTYENDIAILKVCKYFKCLEIYL